MIDADVAPFDSSQWTLRNRHQKLAPGVHVAQVMLTSKNGARLSATPDLHHEDAQLPLWRLQNLNIGRVMGWVVMSSQNPLKDIQAALLRGLDISSRSLPLERYLLQQGLIGGTWRYRPASNDLSDDVRTQAVEPSLGAHLTELDVSMRPLSRFFKTTEPFGLRHTLDIWTIQSGIAAVGIVLPTTRHQALERLGFLQQETKTDR